MILPRVGRLPRLGLPRPLLTPPGLRRASDIQSTLRPSILLHSLTGESYRLSQRNTSSSCQLLLPCELGDCLVLMASASTIEIASSFIEGAPPGEVCQRSFCEHIYPPCRNVIC